MIMEGMFFNGHYIPWPGPPLKTCEWNRQLDTIKCGPEEHDQGESGQEDSGE
jgi:hypothetical protein